MDVHQWNRAECPEINLYFSGQLTFQKAAKALLMGKEVFSTTGAGKESIHMQENVFGPLSPATYKN